MNQRQIDQYFRALAQKIRFSCTIILTGAAAGALSGRVRPSLDIDFAVTFPRAARRKRQVSWDEFREATRQVTQITGIAVNFAEDIDRWSMISFLDYRDHTVPYKQFGRLRVRILAPEYWAIGKFARYLDPDVQDLIVVLRKRAVPALKLAKLLGKALRKSPRSASQFLFQKQVEHFMNTYGTRVWGKWFLADKILESFYASGAITKPGQRKKA